MQIKAREGLFWSKGQQTFSIKDQLANILGFVGHMVSITTIQFCL